MAEERLLLILQAEERSIDASCSGASSIAGSVDSLFVATRRLIALLLDEPVASLQSLREIMRIILQEIFCLLLCQT